MDDEIERILIKYRDGRDLDEEDRALVDNLCDIGFMKRGISLRRLKVTAKTISLGLKLIDGSV